MYLSLPGWNDPVNAIIAVAQSYDLLEHYFPVIPGSRYISGRSRQFNSAQDLHDFASANHDVSLHKVAEGRGHADDGATLN